MQQLRLGCSGTSDLQTKADKYFCGDSSVLRLTEENPPKWVCLPIIKDVKLYSQLKCVDSCGSKVHCVSPMAPIVLDGELEVYTEFLKENASEDCCRALLTNHQRKTYMDGLLRHTITGDL